MNAARRLLFAAALLGLVLAPAAASAQKVFLNPSNQVNNAVCAGGVESTYAMDNANIAAGILTNSGFDVQVSDDFNGGNAAAASWGAQIFWLFGGSREPAVDLWRRRPHPLWAGVCTA